ncbi:choloylglycine hydrolase [Candidatus Saccharibacteria bacterium]|nr:choloylglycine hydrolase [Candidatus Saccharibacteria bacterium]
MCTGVRFNGSGGEMYFGRNLDWSNGYGQKVVFTPRGYQYHSAFLGTIQPKHGAIIGMAIIAENVPLYFDCANEDGLGVAGLNFPGYAKYEDAAVDGKTNVAAYEFPLWLTLNFSTVDEAEAALKNTAIVAQPLNANYPVSQLHFMICDKTRSIVVEYTENGMEIHENDADVLTNQPGYAWHKENLRNYMNLYPQMPKEIEWTKVKLTAFGSGSLMRGLPGDYYSTSRFVRVAYCNTHYPVKTTEADNVSRLFHTLASVAMIDGAARMADGNCEITVYTGGYSAASKTYYYNTYENPAIVSVPMSNFNMDGAELAQA